MSTHTKTLLKILLLFSFMNAFSQDSTSFQCGYLESEEIENKLRYSRNIRIGESEIHMVRLGIEIDYLTYSEFNFDSTQIYRELLIMTEKISKLFEREAGVRIILSYVHIWNKEEEDPYSGENDVFKLLNIAATINNGFPKNNKPFDLLMYLPTKSFSGAGGVAGGRTNVSPWGNLFTIAHELGHNFGVPHTQSCLWPNGPLDHCYPAEGDCYINGLNNSEGTIMSYCGDREVRFHPTVSHAIRVFASIDYPKITSSPEQITFKEDTIFLENSRSFIFPFVKDAIVYEYQLSTDSNFQNILYEGESRINEIYLNTELIEAFYFLRIRSTNQFGISDWAKLIVHFSPELSPPVISDNDKSVLYTYGEGKEIMLPSAPSGMAYEMLIANSYLFRLPQPDEFSKYSISSDKIELEEIIGQFSTDNYWKIRTVNGDVKGPWSRINTIYPKNLRFRSVNSSFYDPSEFITLSGNDYPGEKTKISLYEIENGNRKLAPDQNIVNLRFYRNIQPLKPNTSYELQFDVYKDSIADPFNERKTGLLHSYFYPFHSGNSFLDSKWILGSNKTPEMRGNFYTSNVIRVGNKVFFHGEEGIFEFDSFNKKFIEHNDSNTNGLITNRLMAVGKDSLNNFWVLQPVSIRKSYDGAFPKSVIGLLNIDIENLTVKERIEFENFPTGVLVMDMEQRTFLSWQKIFHKIQDDKIVDVVDLSSTLNHEYYNSIQLINGQVWLVGNRNGNAADLISVSMKDGSLKEYNAENSTINPERIDRVMGNSRDEIILFNSRDRLIHTIKPDGHIIQTNFNTPTSYYPATATIGPNDSVFILLKHYWSKEIMVTYMLGNELKVYEKFNDLNNIRSFDFDQNGNIILTTWGNYYHFNKCSDLSFPQLDESTRKIKYGESIEMNSSGCSSARWEFSDGNNFSINDNEIQEKRIENSVTYSISCTDGFCKSNSLKGSIELIPLLSFKKKIEDSVHCISENLIIDFNGFGINDYSTISIVTSDNENAIQIPLNNSEGSYFVGLKNLTEGKSYWLKLFDNETQTYSIDSIQIQIAPGSLYQISGDAFLCSDFTKLDLLTEKLSTNIKWEKDGQVLSDRSSLSVSEPGLYKLSFMNSFGCLEAEELVISDFRIPNPVISVLGDTSFIHNKPTTLQLKSTNQVSNINWFKDGEVISGETSSKLLATETGQYYVIVSNDFCQKVSPEVNLYLILASNSIKEEGSELIISPNPTKERLQIMNLPETQYSLTLVNINGKKFECSVIDSEIQVNNLPAGRYIIKVESNDQIFKGQFIKE